MQQNVRANQPRIQIGNQARIQGFASQNISLIISTYSSLNTTRVSFFLSRFLALRLLIEIFSWTDVFWNEDWGLDEESSGEDAATSLLSTPLGVAEASLPFVWNDSLTISSVWVSGLFRWEYGYLSKHNGSFTEHRMLFIVILPKFRPKDFIFVGRVRSLLMNIYAKEEGRTSNLFVASCSEIPWCTNAQYVVLYKLLMWPFY